MPGSLSELDLAIVHALQIDGRAPWARIAAAVGADTGTVTRHWQDLRAGGLAWTTIWPTPERWARTTDVALVLMDADAAARDAIALMPWVIALDETSAGVLAVVAESGGLEAIGARVRTISGLGAGIRRADVAASIAQEDSTWRLQALSRAQQRLLVAPAGARRDVRPPSPEVTAEIAAALADDPRLAVLTLGRRLGVSEPTMRRTLDRAIAAGVLRFGCDLAMSAAGLGRAAVLWARARDVDAAADRAGLLAETHRAGVVVGPSPVFASVRMRTLTALPSIEHRWQDAAAVEVADRWTVLRTWKRNGHLLDGEGRSIRRIPVEW
ncbi:AsnC family transcriptional regulator [Microbacterium sp. RG1]|uniref:AsnC family transcriptional regulator n=1 Tax=Microbacterium sp. RG1 TaxID=2489212 RepID=UPI0010CA29C3|nr:AsnC family transcriptional regulator [Microbacterium sp. RG1]QCQ17998.1 AsnC family transcriptional regulator [Microbacterium sp. RG1]